MRIDELVIKKEKDIQQIYVFVFTLKIAGANNISNEDDSKDYNFKTRERI